jgi:CBS domain-containing protein
MKVSAILKRKGSDVHTVAPTATVAEVSRLLREHRVGALVVSSDGARVAGIVSERDVVRRVAEVGADGLADTVDVVMTAVVVPSTRSATPEQLMEVVTRQRIRHLPGVEDDRLVGLVSIGDIVAARVRELEDEAKDLRDYITTG